MRASFLTLIVLAAGSLLADPVDPSVTFNSGGHHSTPILCNTDGCDTPLPDIADGGGTFDVINESGKNIFELIFFIPTINFDQIFNASSNLYLNAFISLDPNEDTADGDTVVTFVGTGNGADGTASAGPLGSCDSSFDSDASACAAGFENGPGAFVEAIFGGPGKGDHPGLPSSCPDNTETGGFCEGVLTLQPSVPEPGSFVLFFSAAALLLGGRRLYRR